MQTAFLLLPDFLLIVVGFFVCRYTPLDRSVWDGAERLVYYLLFPVLLFNSIVRNPLQPGALATLGVAGLAVVGTGILLSLSLARWPGVDARIHASGAQVAFRFNSYIALALAERIGGAPGLAAVALLVAVAVPACNIAAVWPLARHGGHGFLRELVRNPLIVSTLAGLAASLIGVRFPEAVGTTLNRIGLAALPIGLMAVGAGLRFGALRDAPRLAAALLAIRHLALPLLTVVFIRWTDLPPVQQLVVVAFSALPTASSCYVLAARLGGHASFVAGLVTVSTLLGMLSVPLALAAFAALGPPLR
ncbi:AEC family transporter [Aquincola sp. MAHUQ-54]|uniref:AEC family transporter n=1 Tax=Aquincola agrisoli TaxID=3119538 RepID=A0AAW9Q6M5_9BURK